MSSINSINNSAYLEKALASQAGGSTQETGKANNAFADLFQSILDGTASAQTTAPAAAASGVNALGPSLAGGNLSAAQLAFQSLQTDPARKAHAHHHPRPDADVVASNPAGGTSTTGSTAVTPVSSPTPSDLLNLLMS